MAEKQEEKSQTPPLESAGAGKKHRRKKINKMTGMELEDVLKKTQAKMGGCNSRYAADLLKRKNALREK